MLEIRQTDAFGDWLDGLRDKKAQERISMRLIRVAAGLLGDTRSVGGGVSELRIDHGPGYRVYFARREEAIIVLLCGGDKGSQQRDIRAAKALAKDL